MSGQALGFHSGKVFQAVGVVVRMLDCRERSKRLWNRMGPLTNKQIIHTLFHLFFRTSIKMNRLPEWKHSGSNKSINLIITQYISKEQ